MTLSPACHPELVSGSLVSARHPFQIPNSKFQITGIKPYTTERLRKLSPTSYGFDESNPYISGDEGIAAGASIPPGFAPALAELERGSGRATPKTIPSSQLPVP